MPPLTFQTPPVTPTVKRLTIALFAAFVVQLILENWVAIPIFHWLALDTNTLSVSTIWQIFTYCIAVATGPNSVPSFLFNLFFVWWMLSSFESRFGSRRTLELCAVSTVCSGIAAIVVGQLVGGSVPLFGTTPWLLASIAAIAWTFRGHGRVSLFGFIDITAQQTIGVLVAMSVVMFLATRQLTQLAADLAAIGSGIFLIQRPRKRSGGTSDFFKKSRDSQRLRILN